MRVGVGRLLLYVRDIAATTDFYARLFGYEAVTQARDRIVELRPAGPGLPLLLHPAAKGQRSGQAQVKLVFDVEDVPGFVAAAAERGIPFGTVHDAGGYLFANARDPAGNSVSVSGRAHAGQEAGGAAAARKG
ncbi:VOC family protein [Pseudoroseicyclus sp. CLL3-39]|uniref:VOC family protein n=1 Tax=Pseudoroseicyclus tamaricis TaxID=2705421 RepID=A0A6B2K5R0_9RHOB|nr:VOC family protein [Pseudoroseicyclus tamaricis]